MTDFFHYPKVFPKAVLFDWDSTLVDTWELLHQGLNHACQAHGLPTLSREGFLKMPPLSTRDFFKKALGENQAQLSAEKVFREFVLERHIHHFSPLPGSERLLRFLASKSVYMAVVSNKEGLLLRREVAHLGWDKYFKKIIGSRDTQEDKPSGLPIRVALDNHCIAQEAWFVGDSIVDVQAAHQAGLIPVTIDPDLESPHIPVVRNKHNIQLLQLLESFVEPTVG
jgi:phosphoglycolate phosphatase